jgi:hypothetical protein
MSRQPYRGGRGGSNGPQSAAIHRGASQEQRGTRQGNREQGGERGREHIDRGRIIGARGGRTFGRGPRNGLVGRHVGRTGGRLGPGHQNVVVAQPLAAADAPPPELTPPVGQQYDSNQICVKGLELAGFNASRQNVSAKLNDKRFRAFYGVGPAAVARLYARLREHDEECDLKKLFMSLNWLKLYDPESVLAARWDMSEETLRVVIRTYVSRISSLRQEKIQFGPFGDEIFIVSVDGTHCPVLEPRTDPSSKWYSYKFNGAGLSYELAIAIHSQRLVWINGPFPALQEAQSTLDD